MSSRITDLSELKLITGENSDFLKEIIGIFLQQVPDFLHDLQTGVQSQNYELIRKTAHKMHVSLSTVGMKDLSLRIREMEQNASEAKNFDSIRETVELTIQSCNQAVGELTEELNLLK